MSNRHVRSLAAAAIVLFIAANDAFAQRRRDQGAPAGVVRASSSAASAAQGREPAPGAHSLDPALEWMKQCAHRCATVQDYTATFVRQERIGRKMAPVEYMKMKVREQPFSVYFQWIEPNAGREAIFVAGRDGDKIVTHATGLAKAFGGTVLLDPEGPMARSGSRHSITEAGVGNLVRRLVTRWTFERQYNDTETKLARAKLNGRDCCLITTVHPGADDGRFMFHTLKVYIDIEEMLPIRMEGYAYPPTVGREPGPLVECYTYLDLRTNAQLDEIDFSPENPDYNFGRF
ncbi:MAG: DUF1571 domain-containing protein [Planctomycetia bacterium]